MKNDYLDYDLQYTLIELTNYCNYRCPMCPQSQANGVGPRGYMTFETFKNIIDSLPRKKKPHGVKPFWLGEPMLHPEFKKFLRYACEKLAGGKEYIVFDTNGSLMDKEVTELLLEFGNIIPLFTVSLDAIHKETYERIRVGGIFENVMNNVEYFIKRRFELKKISPRIVLQFILMKENCNEVNEFIDYWKDFLKRYFYPGNKYHKDVIWIKREHHPNPEKQKENDKFFAEQVKQKKLKSMDLDYAKIEVVASNNWSTE